MAETTAAVATRDFVDHWCGDFVTGDLAYDFTDAVGSARWNDDVPEGGTLANKDTVTLITDEAMTSGQAQKLAEQLLAADDPRVSDPYGPAGAIRIAGSCGWTAEPTDNHGWALFGRALITPCPPLRDDFYDVLKSLASGDETDSPVRPAK